MATKSNPRSDAHVTRGTAPAVVCIDARLQGGMSGGVEQTIVSLAAGLSGLTDGDERFVFLTLEGQQGWLEGFVGGPCRLVGTLRSESSALGRRKRQLGARAPLLRSAWRSVRRIPIPRSDGTVERIGVDVMHFPTQQAFLTSIPSIYQPWDLQHLHHPAFFPAGERRERDVRYGTFCRQASLIVVASSQVRNDIARHYGVEPEKIAVVPMAPPTAAYGKPVPSVLERVRRRLGSLGEYAYFPGQTWAHKNHLRLLEALALLRDRDGIIVPLVCSGRTNDFYPRIASAVERLGLAEQVLFLGFVEPAEVVALYELCRCVVFPTLFEGWGNPVTEAFLAERPIACSRITPLTETAGDAALWFDPEDPEAIAAEIRAIWRDDALRARLVKRGRERVRPLRLDRMARHFRAHYRRLAGSRLTVEDRSMLAASHTLAAARG